MLGHLNVLRSSVPSASGGLESGGLESRATDFGSGYPHSGGRESGGLESGGLESGGVESAGLQSSGNGIRIWNCTCLSLRSDIEDPYSATLPLFRELMFRYLGMICIFLAV